MIWYSEWNVFKHKTIKLFFFQVLFIMILSYVFKYFTTIEDSYLLVLGWNYQSFSYYMSYVCYALHIFFTAFVCLYMFLESFKFGAVNIALRGDFKKWYICKMLFVLGYILFSQAVLYAIVMGIHQINPLEWNTLQYYLIDILYLILITFICLAIFIYFQNIYGSLLGYMILFIMLAAFPISIILFPISIEWLLGITILVTVLLYFIFCHRYFTIYEKL